MNSNPKHPINIRKCALPSELANLSDAQSAQVNDSVDRFTFAKVEELFLEAHGIPIGRGKLARYNSRRLTARALSQAVRPRPPRPRSPLLIWSPSKTVTLFPKTVTTKNSCSGGPSNWLRK